MHGAEGEKGGEGPKPAIHHSAGLSQPWLRKDLGRKDKRGASEQLLSEGAPLSEQAKESRCPSMFKLSLSSGDRTGEG